MGDLAVGQIGDHRAVMGHGVQSAAGDGANPVEHRQRNAGGLGHLNKVIRQSVQGDLETAGGGACGTSQDIDGNGFCDQGTAADSQNQLGQERKTRGNLHNGAEAYRCRGVHNGGHCALAALVAGLTYIGQIHTAPHLSHQEQEHQGEQDPRQQAHHDVHLEHIQQDHNDHKGDKAAPGRGQLIVRHLLRHLIRFVIPLARGTELLGPPAQPQDRTHEHDDGAHNPDHRRRRGGGSEILCGNQVLDRRRAGHRAHGKGKSAGHNRGRNQAPGNVSLLEQPQHNGIHGENDDEA